MLYRNRVPKDTRAMPAQGAGATPASSLGMTMLEVMLVSAIAVIALGMSVPGTLNSLHAYHLHSDATSVASYLNLTRMRAASQYVPYSLDVSAATNTFAVEQLAPISYNPIPISAPTTSSYMSQSPAVYEYGTQYLSSGNTVSTCLPTASSAFPAPVSANPASCGASFQIYFNTRGLPVDSTGSALASGGSAIYLTGSNGLIDAVTVSAGGAVQTWSWNPTTSQWSAR